MTTKTQETFIFAHDELRAMLALCFAHGATLITYGKIKPEDGRMLMDKAVAEMIEIKRQHDRG